MSQQPMLVTWPRFALYALIHKQTAQISRRRNFEFTEFKFELFWTRRHSTHTPIHPFKYNLAHIRLPTLPECYHLSSQRFWKLRRQRGWRTTVAKNRAVDWWTAAKKNDKILFSSLASTISLFLLRSFLGFTIFHLTLHHLKRRNLFFFCNHRLRRILSHSVRLSLTHSPTCSVCLL